MSPGKVFIDLKFFPVYVIVILIGVIVSAVLAPFFGRNRQEKKWRYIFLGVLCIAAITAIICVILALCGNPGFTTGIEITYYAACIILGMGAAMGVSAYLFKQKGFSPTLVFDFAIVLIPLSILGARIFYVAFDPSSSISSFVEFIAIWNGGLAIYGGIIGGALSVLIVCLYKKINFLDIADCVAVALILGQAIGRWGNFFNSEVYGLSIINEALHWFPMGVLINGSWRYALFFYEFFFNLLGFVGLFLLSKKYVNRPKGIILCGYLIWYGTVRAVLETFRDAKYQLGNASLIVSIVMIAIGVGVAIFQYVMFQKARKQQVDKKLGLVGGKAEKSIEAEKPEKAAKTKKTEKAEETAKIDKPVEVVKIEEEKVKRTVKEQKTEKTESKKTKK